MKSNKLCHSFCHLYSYPQYAFTRTYHHTLHAPMPSLSTSHHVPIFSLKPIKPILPYICMAMLFSIPILHALCISLFFNTTYPTFHSHPLNPLPLATFPSFILIHPTHLPPTHIIFHMYDYPSHPPCPPCPPCPFPTHAHCQSHLISLPFHFPCMNIPIFHAHFYFKPPPYPFFS